MFQAHIFQAEYEYIPLKKGGQISSIPLLLQMERAWSDIFEN